MAPPMSVRVRFAPSPTGDLHIGGVRTALYNFLHARHEKGTFVLRIEDTDQQRNREDSLRTIKEGLAWCGIAWDEGPHYQSLRLDRYRECADELLRKGRAYWKEDPDKGKALYFAIDRGRIAWKDLIHEEIGFDTSPDPDLVIIRSNGFPTYNFAVVVDDHDMNITRVLRGDEHIPNTPKQLSLYRAFGWTPPEFGHMPLILDPDGAKLSKREIEKYRAMGLPVTVDECRRLGYLPETIVNTLALLGWSPGKDIENMSLEEMVRLFTVERVGSTAARFDLKKLQSMNGHYIRQCPLDRLVELCRPYLEEKYGHSAAAPDRVREAVRQQQERLTRLDQIAGLTRFVFAPQVEVDPKAVEKWIKADGGRDILAELRGALAGIEEFGKGPIEALLKSMAGRRGVKLAKVAQPLRVAVTGSDASPPIDETLAVVGKERVLARIDAMLARL